MKKIKIEFSIDKKVFTTSIADKFSYHLSKIGLHHRMYNGVKPWFKFFGSWAWDIALDVPNYYDCKKAENILREEYDNYVKHGNIKSYELNITEEVPYSSEDTGLDKYKWYPLCYNIISGKYNRDMLKSIIDFDYFAEYNCDDVDEIVDMLISDIEKMSGVKKGEMNNNKSLSKVNPVRDDDDDYDSDDDTNDDNYKDDDNKDNENYDSHIRFWSSRDDDDDNDRDNDRDDDNDNDNSNDDDDNNWDD